MVATTVEPETATLGRVVPGVGDGRDEPVVRVELVERLGALVVRFDVAVWPCEPVHPLSTNATAANANRGLRPTPERYRRSCRRPCASWFHGFDIDTLAARRDAPPLRFLSSPPIFNPRHLSRDILAFVRTTAFDDTCTGGVADDDGASGGDRARTTHRRHRRRRLVLLAISALLAIPAWSLGRTLAANTTDPLSVRVVEWARDHYLGGVVGFVEREWYSHHQPPKGGTPKGGIPSETKLSGGLAKHSPASHASGVARPTVPVRPPDVRPLVGDPLPGEGAWQPSGHSVDGRPVLGHLPASRRRARVSWLAWHGWTCRVSRRRCTPAPICRAAVHGATARGSASAIIPCSLLRSTAGSASIAAMAATTQRVAP